MVSIAAGLGDYENLWEMGLAETKMSVQGLGRLVLKMKTEW